jgi:tetratricopeptide (TPR) repeat protein/predicted aspartyl protease
MSLSTPNSFDNINEITPSPGGCPRTHEVIERSVMRSIILALLAVSIVPSSAHAKCQIGQLLELRVTMQGTRPVADIGVNGRSLPFIVDSGAFFSTISPGTAQELGLSLQSTGLEMRGIGGEAGRTSVARVKSLDLGGVSLHDMEFFVGGSEVGVAGLLGQNILGVGDVEYDLGHGAIRVMRSKGCSTNDDLAYWSGQLPVSDLGIEERDALHPHTIGTVLINGVKVRAIFDTGAGSSVLSLDAARRAGITTSSPGVVFAGQARGLGRSMVTTWTAPVDSVKIGTEEVRHIKLHIGRLDIGDADMLIGADFFLSHRVYVSNALHRIYFTYDGGPVFNSEPTRIMNAAGLTETLPVDNAPTPTDAAGFSRRGAAETSRRDYKAALADLDRAVAMDPGNGEYLLLRARARALSGDKTGAFADLDRAAQVSPNDPEIRLAHAESLLARKRKAEALTDLEAVDAALPKQADQRLSLAGNFTRLDQFDRAIADYDMWIAAHPDDSRQPNALNGRCWARALAGRDLPLALKDCDAALRREKSASYFDSRGLVELRMGEYDKAIADYTAALQLAPRTAWSLYGRALARRHKNDPASQSDVAAAVAIDPALPARAQALGVR